MKNGNLISIPQVPFLNQLCSEPGTSPILKISTLYPGDTFKPGLTLYSSLLMLFFAWMMVYYGYKMTHLQYLTHQKTIIMQIPLVAVYAIMPVMGVMVGIRTVQTMIQAFKSN